MRSLSTTLLLICGLAGNAQDWALINPAYRYNYSDDGTDTISNQIRVMDVDTLGPDSFRFALNPIALTCDPCSDVPPGCNSGGSGSRIGQPQLFGLGAEVDGNSWLLLGHDTLLILADALVGTSWTGPAGIEGTVASAAEQMVLSELDSVKTVEFSNGASLTLSKGHGIIAYEGNGGSHALVGIQGGMDAGERLPTMIDFFDYQPGDILQYHGTTDGTDGVCYDQGVYTRKYRILSRVEGIDRTDLEVREVLHQQTWASPLIGGGGCSSSEYGWIDTLDLGIVHDRWTEENFLGSSWMDHLWPQAFAPPPPEGQYSGAFGSDYHGSQWKTYIDDEGRYVFEPAGNGEPMWMRPAFIECAQDTTYWSVSDYIGGRYVEGIGRTYGMYFVFEHAGEEFLEGYFINGVEYGTIDPDDIILGSQPDIHANEPPLYPNPADDLIQPAQTTPDPKYRIADLQGRIMSTGTLSTSGHITVRSLPPGGYLLLREGCVPEHFMIVR